MKPAALFRQYLLPGIVFQSVVIGGGYGTGRELVEFFLRYGPTGGLVAMLCVSMVIWSAVAAVSFAFAHVTEAYDHRRFIKHLLGRAWVAYEVCYLLILVLVLAVIGAAAGQILLEALGVPYAVGVLVIMAIVSAVVLGGSNVVERVFAVWSSVLYGLYIVVVVLSFVRYGTRSSAPSRTESSARDGSWRACATRATTSRSSRPSSSSAGMSARGAAA